jgi:hypothetical protein
MGEIGVSRLDKLVRELSRLPDSRIGKGPRHPTHPDPRIGPQIDAFFAENPMLGRDPAYVEFQYGYAGAGVFDEAEEEVYLDIVGFTDASTPIDDEGLEFSLRDEGLFVFAMAVYYPDRETHRPWQLSFAFDLTGQREAGVYRLVASPGPVRSDWKWYCSGFLTWLEQVVEHRAMLPI